MGKFRRKKQEENRKYFDIQLDCQTAHFKKSLFIKKACIDCGKSNVLKAFSATKYFIPGAFETRNIYVHFECQNCGSKTWTQEIATESKKQLTLA